MIRQKHIAIRVLLFIGILAWALSPSMIVVALMRYSHVLPFPIQIVSTVAWSLFTIITIVFLWRYYKKISNDPTASFTGSIIKKVVLIWFVLRVAVMVAAHLMQAVYGDAISANDAAIHDMLSSNSSQLFLLLLYISIAFVAPILEELTFRGIFSHLFFANPNHWSNALVSSLLFASFHASTNIISFSMYVALGYGMFYAYQLRGNIKDAILLHTLNNAISLFLYLILSALHIV